MTPKRRDMRAAAAILAAMLLAGCASAPAAPGVRTATTTADGLVIEELAPGDGTRANPGSDVVLRVTGRLADGTVVQPETEIGPWPLGQLVPGLVAGLDGLAEGGRRRLTIPPPLGYGDEAVLAEDGTTVVIPPGSTLVYDVELLEVRAPEVRTSQVADGPAGDGR